MPLQQLSPTRGTNVALFKKIMALLKSRGAKKRSSKFGKTGKKARVDGPQQKKFLIFPFFGPLTTKCWRPMIYNIYVSIILLIEITEVAPSYH